MILVCSASSEGCLFEGRCSRDFSRWTRDRRGRENSWKSGEGCVAICGKFPLSLSQGQASFQNGNGAISQVSEWENSRVILRCTHGHTFFAFDSWVWRFSTLTAWPASFQGMQGLLLWSNTLTKPTSRRKGSFLAPNSWLWEIYYGESRQLVTHHIPGEEVRETNTYLLLSLLLLLNNSGPKPGEWCPPFLGRALLHQWSHQDNTPYPSTSTPQPRPNIPTDCPDLNNSQTPFRWDFTLCQIDNGN